MSLEQAQEEAAAPPSGAPSGVKDDDDMFHPSGVVGDSQAQERPSPLINNYRFRLGTCLAVVVVIAVAVGTAAGILLSNEKEGAPGALAYRDTVGIRDNVERFLDDPDKLSDPASPYSKALRWITYEDAIQMEPDHKNFLQRYLAAYFYYATSEKGDWESGCDAAKEGESADCIFKQIYRADEHFTLTTPSKRWLSANDECSWAGILCSKGDQVQSIKLSGPKLGGIFPEGVAGFPFLQSLQLQHAQLEGPLPKIIGDMKHLVHLELESNRFTGSIPNGWYESPRNLHRIDLGDNQVSGPISSSIGNLKDAKHINLGGNKLFGEIPDEIGALNSVSNLYLEKNILNGTIPTTIGNLRDHWRVSLELMHNKLTGTMPTEIGSISALFEFSVAHNQLVGQLPQQLYKLTTLFQLDVSDNQLTGTISPSIGALLALTVLRVNKNSFFGSIPTEMGLPARLTEVKISGNDFTGSVPTTVCDLVLLETLEADCLGPTSGVPEIECECCTKCCNVDGDLCDAVPR